MNHRVFITNEELVDSRTNIKKPNSPLVWANYKDQTAELTLNVRELPPKSP